MQLFDCTLASSCQVQQFQLLQPLQAGHMPEAPDHLGSLLLMPANLLTVLLNREAQNWMQSSSITSADQRRKMTCLNLLTLLLLVRATRALRALTVPA